MQQTLSVPWEPGTVKSDGSYQAKFAAQIINDPGHMHGTSHWESVNAKHRRDKIDELKELIKMYLDLKGVPELTQPIEDTIKRYTAELYFLK